MNTRRKWMLVNRRNCLSTLFVFAAALPCSGADTQNTELVSKADFEPVDKKRDRTVPIRVYFTDQKKAVPVVLFSHGLGGSRDGNPYLGNRWAKEGFIAVFIQHHGSDRDVMKDVPLREKFSALKDAASLKSSLDRLSDVSFVIDQLEQWNQTKEHPLFQKMDLQHIGLSGHSFGAVTTLGVAGQRRIIGPAFDEKRIDAFLAMSPQPGKGLSPEKSLAGIERPMLCMTGTNDNSPIDPTVTPEVRQLVYKALPDGDKYHLVFDGGNHYTFSDAAGILRRGRNPNHHPAIETISVKFWKAYLSDDKAAKKWLQSESPMSDGTLQPADVWRWK
ncbi:MAG: dienelactone hydrolase [Planctomycetales bacterium]|nr:dienelactone hydrolase [Planctomycetales bacterium]